MGKSMVLANVLNNSFHAISKRAFFLNRFFGNFRGKSGYFHGNPGDLLIFYVFVMKVPLNLSKCSVKCLQEGLSRTLSLIIYPYVTVITL